VRIYQFLHLHLSEEASESATEKILEAERREEREPATPEKGSSTFAA
jgi:hypothetical protein